MSTARSYEAAVNKLTTLATNHQVLQRNHDSGNFKQIQEGIVPSHIEYLERLGYKASDLNKLNVIHITGTKGKGSTSAFCDSILRNLDPNLKVGLYTSPHLCSVRERIRINGKPLDEEKFSRYFFEVWDKFEQTADQRKQPDSSTIVPYYFRYLTLMAFHVFAQEKVDLSIFEVGVGGQYDITNIVPSPLSTGVSALGIDHVAVLGHTLHDIARQKGGIYKPGVPALSVPQPEEGLSQLRQRAKENNASSFSIVEPLSALDNVKLGIPGKHQKSNASLAIALIQAARTSPNFPKQFSNLSLPLQESSSPSSLPKELISPTNLEANILKGIQTASWPGRCQIIPEGSVKNMNTVTWFLDGAHTNESLECCAEWFVDEACKRDTIKNLKRIFVFNCSWDRDFDSLVKTVLNAIETGYSQQKSTSKDSPFFDHAIFTSKTTYSAGWKPELAPLDNTPKDAHPLATQLELCKVWNKYGTSNSQSHATGSIQEAVELIDSISKSDPDSHVDVLVTGSLHLIGGFMDVVGAEVA